MNAGRFAHLELPGGYRLHQDERYGYLKVLPRPTDDDLAAFYSQRYQLSDRPHDPTGRVEQIRRLKPEPGRVLDIGCGEGELLEVFTNLGWQAVGIEPGRESAAQARPKADRVIENMLTEAMLDDLGRFDVVILAHVLEHLPRPGEMLEWIHRLLGDGGILYCEVPNDFNAFQLAAAETHQLEPWWIALPDHLNYFDHETLPRLLAGHGFETVVNTTDFPMEMFLLMGDVYVGNPEVGKAMHARRCRFEETLRRNGRSDTLDALYTKLAELKLGRQVIVAARKVA